ncbi:MAG TPA: PASTA domain-containing protein [Gaiellaceae bacterium]|jgi:serine/threonine-protein kinase|nr:PASTA domain-containing protein [Gaiellaceae bacterium]
MSPFRRRRPPDADPEAETVVVEEGPAAERVVEEEEVVPPPPPPRIWPWLLALLLLVIAGAVAFFLLTRQDDKTTMPRVVGLTEAQARAKLADAELKADVDRRPSNRRAGIVIAQTPGAGKQLDEGERVEITVSSRLNKVAVPNVRGLKEGEAKAKLASAGLKSKVERVFAGAPKGEVVDSVPPGGEQVARGTTVTLKVSKGRNLAKVPDVVGKSESDAASILRARGFTPRIFDVPAQEPKGTVVSQSPPPGAQAPPDSRVRINVSSGEPSGQTTERTVTTPTQTTPSVTRVSVPNVVGLAQTPALRQLRAAGLKGVVAYATSNEPRGRVIAQRPTAATQSPRGTQVTITVSAGNGTVEQIAVPDVRGSDLQTATQTLEDAGFRVETIRTAPGDTVNDQQPAPGTTAPRGAVVTLFVGG